MIINMQTLATVMQHRLQLSLMVMDIMSISYMGLETLHITNTVTSVVTVIMMIMLDMIIAPVMTL